MKAKIVVLQFDSWPHLANLPGLTRPGGIAG